MSRSAAKARTRQLEQLHINYAGFYPGMLTISSLEVQVPVCGRQLVPCHFPRSHKAICHISYGASVVELINPLGLALSVC